MDNIIALMNEHRFEEALQEISLLKENNPNTMLFMIESAANMELGRFDSAETSALTAFRMQPCIENYNLLINIYIRTGRHSEALRLNDESIKRFEQADNYRIKTQLLTYLKRPKDAIDNIHKTIRLEPNDSIHYFDLASCYSLLNDYRNALKYIDIAISMSPTPDYYRLKSMVTQILMKQS
ncbi:MAG: hypothetical protein RBQ87_02460 [Candidatus Cloacimonadaceae bacterium]|jgi:tetratricopeptide (TPR) repeat protein|nr:hypothetical protein [Candidatus Cloacimonadaceae bacterium]